MKSIVKSIVLGVLLSVIGVINVEAQCKKEIRISTFNLRMDTPKDSLNSWPNRKEFVKNLIQFHDFEIIGTQEGFIHQIKDILEVPGYAYIGAGRDDGKTKGEHSAIIYKTERFKLLNSGNFWLRENPNVPGLGWDATCCNRIATWGKFLDKNTKKEFYMFNVHFDHQGVIARKESSKLMIKKITEISKNSPVILTGDFNSTPDSDAIKNLKAAYKDSYDVTILPPYGPVGTANAFKFTAPLDNRIDYIFIKGNSKVLKYGVLTDFKNQRYPSDHMPVMVDMEIR